MRRRPHVFQPQIAGFGLVQLTWRLVIVALALFWISQARSAEVLPPAPANHFNDAAGLVPVDVARQLNQELAQFERDTSNQIVVATFPKLQSDSSVDDYAVRVAQRWSVGQKDRKNGAVLFVFKDTRDVRIVTGYGLEGALPDALCKQIIENEIVPRFRAGDFAGGLAAGTRAMMAATRGEYTGTQRLAAEAGRKGGQLGSGSFIVIFLLLMAFSMFRRPRRRNVLFDRRGRRTWLGGPPWGGGMGGGGWGNGGGWGGGGGGTFSGGGGGFGGGGAGGKW